MPITAAFLSTCRTQIAALPELTAFRTAYALYDAASHDDKGRYWVLAFDNGQAGQSPAYRLHKAIRDTVTAQAAITGGMSRSEMETATGTLAGEYVGQPERPMTAEVEMAALQELLLREMIS